MERVATLIHKLLDQYQQQADTGKLLLTTQMLLAELKQSQQNKENSTNSNVAVMMPSATINTQTAAAPVNTVTQPQQNIIHTPVPAPVPGIPKPQIAAAGNVSIEDSVAAVLQSLPPVVPVHAKPVAATETTPVVPQPVPEPIAAVPVQPAPPAAPEIPAVPVQEQTPVPAAEPELAEESQQSPVMALAAEIPAVSPPPAAREPELKQPAFSKEEIAARAKANGNSWMFDPVHDVPTLTHQANKGYELNQLMGTRGESLNERFRLDKQELVTVLQDSPIQDLKKAIGINDRYLFINELFRGDETMYERSIKTINAFTIYPEANYWIQRELTLKLGWNDRSETAQHFYQLVKRRFS